MKATTPPRCCASARTCWQSVVLPDDSGPKISVIRPRGMPPTPRARSRAIEPVGMKSTYCRSAEPSFMIDPRPNCFSIDEDRRVDRACRAPRSIARAVALVRAALSGHRHRGPRSCPLLAGVVGDGPRGDQPSSGSSLRVRRACVPCGSARRSGAVRTSAASFCFDPLSFGFFLASLEGRSREPMSCSSTWRNDATDGPFTPTAPRLHRRSPDRRAAAIPGVSRGRCRTAGPSGSWP